MKKLKKLATFALTAVFAVGMMSMAACGKNSGNDDNEKGVEVSDAEWSNRTNIDFTTCNSFTLTIKNYSTYGKDEAEERGWQSYTSTLKIDNINQIIHDSSTDEDYRNDANDGAGGFVKSNYESFTVAYNGSYYHWESDYVYQLTKADFTRQIEDETMWATSIFQVLSSPFGKMMYKYNKETGMYDFDSSLIPNMPDSISTKQSVQFMSNGAIRVIQDLGNDLMGELIFSNANSTTISIPKKVYNDIDAYIAKNPNQGGSGNSGNTGNSQIQDIPGNSIEVSSSEWHSYLDFDYNSHDNFTLTTREYPTYGLDEIDEWGEWESRVKVTQIDTTNQIIYIRSTNEHYYAYGDGDTYFDESYILLYKGNYYIWNKYSNGYSHIEAITHEDFVSKADNEAMETIIFKSLSESPIKANFKYDKTAGMYNMNKVGTGIGISVQFKDTGTVRVIEQMDSVSIHDIILSDIDATTVSVPQYVYDDIDAWILEQAENANK